MIRQAMGNAKRAVATVLLATAVAFIALGVERLFLQSAMQNAASSVRKAEAVTGQVRLLDAELTALARLVALTGESQWRTEYDIKLKQIYIAIDEAIAMANPAEADRYQRETAKANDRLAALESNAFELAAKGRTADAFKLVSGVEYTQDKIILAVGSDRFSASIVRRAQARLDSLAIKSLVTLVAVIIICAALGLWLWTSLSQGLTRAATLFEEQNQRIRDLAINDPLTGLANRRAFNEALAARLSAMMPGTAGMALMLIDMDRFKQINDQNGHPVGDAVLVEIARRLYTSFGEGAVVGRLGGDEFVVLTPAFQNNAEQLAAQAEKLIARLGEPIVVGDDEFRMGATIGSALAPQDASTADELVRMADVALYHGKNAGRGMFCAFKAEMDAELRARAEVEKDLREALRQGQIQPYFQPLIDLNGGKVIGFEALARWNHPTKGLLMPADFIEVAEETGLIADISFEILRTACAEAAKWTQALPIAVNIAPAQIQDPWLPEKIMAILAEARLPPQRLEIEITENALIENFATAKAVIQFLRSQKIKVSLDDFGTGYSSLSHLYELPFEKIKIDQSFIRTAQQEPESRKIISAIIGLGESLGLSTIAEGVETEDHAAMLVDMGCSVGQGYLFSKAVPAEQAAVFAAALAGQGPWEHLGSESAAA